MEVTQDQQGPSGAAIIAALKTASVEFVAALPDFWTSAGFLWPVSRDPKLRLVRLSKEDEGVSICSALSYCDRRAVLAMQYTGFLDSVNAIRAIAVEYEQPVCMLVGLLQKEPDRVPTDSSVYGVRITQQIVDVMGIDNICIEDTADVALLAPAIAKAYAQSRPFVALIGRMVEA